MICAGFTDSHWLREAFGTVAYGFFPIRTMPPEVAATLIHSADERAAGRRPRARRRLASLRRARRARVTVELDSLAELEPALAADGFFARDDVVAHVYVGYRCSDALRRTRVPGAAGAVRAARRRVRDRAAGGRAPRRRRYAVGPWRATLERGASTRTRSTPCAPRSPRATSTRSTSCST